MKANCFQEDGSARSPEPRRWQNPILLSSVLEVDGSFESSGQSRAIRLDASELSVVGKEAGLADKGEGNRGR